MGSHVAQSNLFFQCSFYTDILRDLGMMGWGLVGLNLALSHQLGQTVNPNLLGG